MDGHQFDDLLRALSRSRRTLLGAALAAAGGATGLSTIEAKKKRKKKCAKKCPTGCCTSKNGKCLQPAQQSSTQCGTGGEICRSTGCGGGGNTCAATCAGCCSGTTCVSPGTTSQCGSGGVACEACTGDEVCEGFCCVPHQKTCTDSGTPCCIGECTNGLCCSKNLEACRDDNDCCQSGTEAVCENSQCVVKTGATCQPGWMCQGNHACPASSICGDPGDCTIPCQEDDRCSEQICIGVLNCCTQATFDECSGAEDFCGCITEGGECTRILL